ncbi:LutC/YkgG family protein [Liquorilactobacillus mali]|uniref:LUD domain-containing protein n=1 Tax=Liquorilactobacillus mali TaxID=1618 RepID=A0A0R2FFV3_9LACO|nr:lactate utilization protein C [Liquorilactobacillus mali]KRN27506.1 hypothetical protein IV36_GL000956 [Liquorilactobacillus mali]
MTNSNREVFLDKIATKAGRTRHQLKNHPFVPINDLPESTLAGKSQDELLELAQKNSEAVHVTFEKTNRISLSTLLNDFLSAKDINNLILPTCDKWAAFGLSDWENKLADSAEFWTPESSRTENLAKVNAADGAIGFADYLLAESGTITVATTPGQGRGFHFLPTHYLSIIPKSHILSRSRQAMHKYEAAIASGKLTTSNINFITGPSNSGDIEMVLVVGVHGPLDMTYVVVEDL